VTSGAIASAQQPPAIRQLATLQRATSDALGLETISSVVAMPGGRVLINDVRSRRVVLFDSTLAFASVVLDTTDATSHGYGGSWTTLIHHRGDSALLLAPATLSMFVIGPTGAVARVMAIPRPNEAQQLAVPNLGMPGIDARGRLVYFGTIGVASNTTLLLRHSVPWLVNGRPGETATQVMSPGGWVSPTLQRTDSAVIARIDFGSRVVDTVARHWSIPGRCCATERSRLSEGVTTTSNGSTPRGA
jgi:hypothetical protein